MATITQDLIKLNHHLDYVLDKVDEGCKLYEENMPVEAEIALKQAVQYSEELIENQPDNSSYLSVLTETHHMVSLGYTSNAEYDKAFKHITKALSLYESFPRKERQYEMTLHSSKARIEVMAGKHAAAIENLEKIVSYFECSCMESFRVEDYLYCSDLLLLAQEYFENDQYDKAVEVTERAIQCKRRKKSVINTQLFNEYLNLLHLASEKAEHKTDDTFQQKVLEEGITACRQEKNLSVKTSLCSLSTFYQDIIKLMFFKKDKAMLKQYEEELVAFCNLHLHEVPRLRVHKISGQLNYAVYCAMEGNDEEAEEAVSQAIGDCMELKDVDALEQTLFLISALHTLSNIKWQNGDLTGALRELERENNILMSFLNTDFGKNPNLYPLLEELVKNEVKLYKEVGKPEEGKAIFEAFKRKTSLP